MVATHEVAIVQHVVAVHEEASVGVPLDGMDTEEDLGGWDLVALRKRQYLCLKITRKEEERKVLSLM